MKKARGSALIIAFMLVAAVGGTVLLIGRLFLMDQASSEIYEDSVVAYYSAESGIEEALLRYRYDKDIEMPKTLGVFDATRVARSNMQSSLPAGPTERYTNRNSILDADPDDDQRFDLTMQNLGSFYGVDADKSGTFDKRDVAHPNYISNNDFIIPKDEAIKINVQETIKHNKDLNIYAKVIPESSLTDQSFIEVRITGKDVGGMQVERKLALYFNSISPIVCPVASDCIKMDPPPSVSIPVFGKNSIKTALVTSGVDFNTSENVVLSIKPINVTIAIGMEPSGTSTQKIAMPYTDVKSTGYFAGYSRTLSAKIDRQSGTVYDLFDYVIYDKK